MKKKPQKSNYRYYSSTLKLKKYDFVVFTDSSGLNISRCAYLVMGASSRKMIFDIIFYSRKMSPHIIRNQRLPNTGDDFVLSIRKEQKKHGLGDITGIMIINLKKSVAGEIEVYLLEEVLPGEASQKKPRGVPNKKK